MIGICGGEPLLRTLCAVTLFLDERSRPEDQYYFHLMEVATFFFDCQTSCRTKTTVRIAGITDAEESKQRSETRVFSM